MLSVDQTGSVILYGHGCTEEREREGEGVCRRGDLKGDFEGRGSKILREREREREKDRKRERDRDRQRERKKLSESDSGTVLCLIESNTPIDFLLPTLPTDFSKSTLEIKYIQ